LVLTPVFGILLFIILYIIAAMLYPGGSQTDINSKGFSWINNYWCNLLNQNAMNGQYNPARPAALTGMVVLCFSLSIFWYVFPQHIGFKKYGRLIIQLSGMLSMIVAVFLFTPLHDTIINVAALFGLIALVGTFTGLYKIRWYSLLYFGIFNILLVGLNNYVYYTKGLIIYLPVIQKISFVSFLFWICCIDIRLYQKTKTGFIVKP
jgi:hypothetical protein